MKKRAVPLLALLAAMLVLSACAGGNPAQSNPIAAANSPSTTDEQSGITASQAEAIAVEMVGGGSMQGIETTTVNGNMQFVVQVAYNENTYNVVLDAASGNFISLRLIETESVEQTDVNLNVVPDYPAHQPTETQPAEENVAAAEGATADTNQNVVPNYPAHQPTEQAPTQQTGNISIPANITPRSPARTGGPANPAISAQRAVELARDHLISIGVTSARFDYVYMDREGQVWVWSVKFDSGGRSYEFYVNVETGAFLRSPQAASATGQQAAPPTTGQITTPSTNNWRGPGRAPANWPSNVAITSERAVEIALERVGGGTVHEVDHDFERGRAAWWVEIRHNRAVYEVKVDVQTGDIVDFERDD